MAVKYDFYKKRFRKTVRKRTGIMPAWSLTELQAQADLASNETVRQTAMQEPKEL